MNKVHSKTGKHQAKGTHHRYGRRKDKEFLRGIGSVDEAEELAT